MPLCTLNETHWNQYRYELCISSCSKTVSARKPSGLFMSDRTCATGVFVWALQMEKILRRFSYRSLYLFWIENNDKGKISLILRPKVVQNIKITITFVIITIVLTRNMAKMSLKCHFKIKSDRYRLCLESASQLWVNGSCPNPLLYGNTFRHVFTYYWSNLGY